MDDLRDTIILIVAVAVLVGVQTYRFLEPRTYSLLEGHKAIRVTNECNVDFLDKRLQPVYTVAVACKGRDMIRVWPLPMVDPWFEDRQNLNQIRV